MNANEILDQLNALTAKVKDLIEGDTFASADGNSEYVTQLEDDYWSLRARVGYSSHVDVLSTVKDTENGYIFHFPSYSSSVQENYVCLDYDEADYIWKLLSYLKKAGA